MADQLSQSFVDPQTETWSTIPGLDGVTLAVLAEPVPDGSIHRAKLTDGTVIPVHTHPCDEYVLVLSGRIRTGGRLCEAGTFWRTPAHVRQGPHEALGDCELLTIRLGHLGRFEG